MSYKVFDIPLGTPMDHHFLGGIPLDVYNQQAAKKAKLLNESEVARHKASENVVVLPIDDSDHPRRKRRNR